ncbi:OmpA family protein [Spirosoma flavum]|uniref:OmpA family protein n=1 Tax=Spirosoma flavum TaxID=2048557 RepID=A0ABW6AER8_9BACT
MKTCCISLLLIGFMASAIQAQVRVSNPGNVVERNVEYRTNSKIDQGINKGLDKVEEGVMGIFKKKDKNKPAPTSNQTDNSNPTTNSNPTSDGGTPANRAGGSNGTVTNTDNVEGGSKAPATLKSYSKFDFVPGEKVIAVEDFMQDAIGDFPDKWNSTGSGEMVTIDGKTGHWLMLNKKGEYLPEFIKSLPDNFTLQFDLACNETFSYYSSYMWINLVAMANPAKDFTKWGRFPSPTEGVRVGLHPRNAGNGDAGITEFITYSKGTEELKNETDQHAFFNATRNMVKVSMWRQKQRLRVYVDETKVWDIPRAFQQDIVYNGVVLSMADMHNNDDRYYVSNFRLAVGAPDTRNKLITEGKFVTHGILFDTNSDKIKPESYGAMKDIAGVLTENADVKVRIIGHTDSDGDDALNMSLSKKRAAAVKDALASTFGIDISRMETDGKGESQPAGLNTTVEGKANNRRVEFIKL